MHTKVILLVVGLLALIHSSPGQATDAEKPPIRADMLARQLVQTIQRNEPPQWRQLIGRDDVLPELRRIGGSLTVQQTRQLLGTVISIGMQEKQRRWVFSDAVAAYLIDATATADSGEIREYAAELLVRYVPSEYIAPHAALLIKAAQDGKLANALLLGKSGAPEAKQLLQKRGKIWSINEDEAQSAIAKLGDADASQIIVNSYHQERDVRKKAILARKLGYICDKACILALARDMRAPDTYDAGGAKKSLRIDIIAALSEAYPGERVFWFRDVQKSQEIDQWYDDVEKWLETHLQITWNTPRPKPFSVMPIPLQ